MRNVYSPADMEAAGFSYTCIGRPAKKAELTQRGSRTVDAVWPHFDKRIETTAPVEIAAAE